MFAQGLREALVFEPDLCVEPGAVALSEGVGSPPPPPPIVNGETTDDYPQVVLIRFTTPSESVAFVCTGTLVAPDVVLTAAHCLTDPDGYGLTDVRVFMGTVWTPAAPERLASEWIIHPEYSVDPDGTNVHADLGLVWLPEPYDLDGEVLNAQPITEADWTCESLARCILDRHPELGTFDPSTAWRYLHASASVAIATTFRDRVAASRESPVTALAAKGTPATVPQPSAASDSWISTRLPMNVALPPGE